SKYQSSQADSAQNTKQNPGNIILADNQPWHDYITKYANPHDNDSDSILSYILSAKAFMFSAY
ncbi:MAG TPA: hypothetical protein VKA09_17315, partial [Nitrososphaeraceae archaeon]|nr:hypothetical protein [Nitrososphaeraceae archaeon]